MHAPEPAPSYRALLQIPTIGRILLGMALSRIGGSMFGVAIVLFTLDRYRVAGPRRCSSRSRASRPGCSSARSSVRSWTATAGRA